jgi:hypothetical protein
MNKNGKTLACTECGKGVYIAKYRLKTFKFCSTRCAFIHNDVLAKKPPLTEESKRKISKSLVELYEDITKHPRYVNGKHRHGDGYVQLYKPDHPSSDSRGRVMEHRYILEVSLRRVLTDQEEAHHINGIKDDNRLENLQILSPREHQLLEWELGRKENAKKTWIKKGQRLSPRTEFKKGENTYQA